MGPLPILRSTVQSLVFAVNSNVSTEGVDITCSNCRKEFTPGIRAHAIGCDAHTHTHTRHKTNGRGVSDKLSDVAAGANRDAVTHYRLCCDKQGDRHADVHRLPWQPLLLHSVAMCSKHRQ